MNKQDRPTKLLIFPNHLKEFSFEIKIHLNMNHNSSLDTNNRQWKTSCLHCFVLYCLKSNLFLFLFAKKIKLL